ncbi:MAG TPA: hypothetical protein VJ957_10635 [Longimicrobiales bacterium]|nr:hypothetical protein [Longimicrobiales bacterium]
MAKQPAPKATVIDIGVKGDAIDVPATSNVQSGGTLNWKSSLGPWVVVFDGDKPPSSQGPFHDNDRERRPGDGKSRDVRKHAKATTYKYSVALYHEKRQKVYLADPEVIVDPAASSET